MYVAGLRVIYSYKVKNVNIYLMNSLIFKISSKLFYNRIKQNTRQKHLSCNLKHWVKGNSIRVIVHLLLFYQVIDKNQQSKRFYMICNHNFNDYILTYQCIYYNFFNYIYIRLLFIKIFCDAHIVRKNALHVF